MRLWPRIWNPICGNLNILQNNTRLLVPGESILSRIGQDPHLWEVIRTNISHFPHCASTTTNGVPHAGTLPSCRRCYWGSWRWREEDDTRVRNFGNCVPTESTTAIKFHKNRRARPWPQSRYNLVFDGFAINMKTFSVQSDPVKWYSVFEIWIFPYLWKCIPYSICHLVQCAGFNGIRLDSIKKGRFATQCPHIMYQRSWNIMLSEQWPQSQRQES